MMPYHNMVIYGSNPPVGGLESGSASLPSTSIGRAWEMLVHDVFRKNCLDKGYISVLKESKRFVYCLDFENI